MAAGRVVDNAIEQHHKPNVSVSRACMSQAPGRPHTPSLCRWLDVRTKVSEEPPNQSSLRHVCEYLGGWVAAPLIWIALASLVTSRSGLGQSSGGSDDSRRRWILSGISLGLLARLRLAAHSDTVAGRAHLTRRPQQCWDMLADTDQTEVRTSTMVLGRRLQDLPC